jgi:hypothetical protein
MILYGPIQERALDEAQRQIKPVVAVNKPPAVNSRRGAYPGEMTLRIACGASVGGPAPARLPQNR